jgi:tetratricopeptide (TPR) repeat protein
VARETDAGLEALLAPHRAFTEGRAALETLEGGQVARARRVFEDALAMVPEHASAHLGMASACVLQFEMTRADTAPDAVALGLAVKHAREACRLDPHSGEAWATLGFVLDRAGNLVDALAASKRAVTLEPDNWRHHFRLAFVSWGEERLRAANRTLALLPDFPLAHWMAATVYVARQVPNEAERELRAALAVRATQGGGRSRFSSVALHWLLGLIHLAQGDGARALSEFELELSFENEGHLYARECCANTWYAIGALRLRDRQRLEARDAFERAIQRVPAHPMARVGLTAAGAQPPSEAGGTSQPVDQHEMSVESAFARAAHLVLGHAHGEAARLVGAALVAAGDRRAGWLLPIDPLLQVGANPSIWAPVLTQLRNRAA